MSYYPKVHDRHALFDSRWKARNLPLRHPFADVGLGVLHGLHVGGLALQSPQPSLHLSL